MGRSIALTLAREGAIVAVNYLKSADSAAAIVAHIEGQNGRATAFQADVTEQDSCRMLVDATVAAFGRVDICIIGPGGGWHNESVDNLDSTKALDDARKELAPIYHLMPLVLPGMYERQWGRLIAISLAPPYDSPAYAYNVAKAARTHALLIARDSAWKKNVTVNTIGPGPVAQIESLQLLCSEAGNFISGAVLPFMYR
jgi:3-oxoacyl-[acyl-carrier protein] reductase